MVRLRISGVAFYATAVLCCFSTLPISAQQSVSSQVSAAIDGWLIDDTEPDQYTATGGASRLTSPISRGSGIKLLRPSVNPIRGASWGGVIFPNSVGSSFHSDIRGISTHTQSTPFVYGSGVEVANGGGAIGVFNSGMLTGIPAGELRFRTIDHSAAIVNGMGHSASSSLLGSRAAFQGLMQGQFVTAGVTGARTYEADLNLMIRYGADGEFVPGTETKYYAGRQVDLDVVCFQGGRLPANFNMKVRASGVTAQSPMGTGWSNRQPLVSSVVRGTDSLRNTSMAPVTIQWGNGQILNNPTGPYGTLGPWGSSTSKMRVRLPSAWQLRVDALTQNIARSSQRDIGRVKVPASSSGLGNGVEVRIWFSNVVDVTPPPTPVAITLR